MDLFFTWEKQPNMVLSWGNSKGTIMLNAISFNAPIKAREHFWDSKTEQDKNVKWKAPASCWRSSEEGTIFITSRLSHGMWLLNAPSLPCSLKDWQEFKLRTYFLSYGTPDSLNHLTSAFDSGGTKNCIGALSPWAAQYWMYSPI